MSQFLLARPDRFDAAVTVLAPLLERHGFGLREDQTIGQWRLLLIDNPQMKALERVDLDAGTALVALGYFVYDGRAGRDAVEAFARDFDPAAPDWSKTEGHFTLLRIEPERVVVLCDGLGAHKIYHDAEHTVFSNAFVTVLAALQAPRLQPQGAFEYAWCGACYGTRTFIEDLYSLPANSILEAGQDTKVKQHTPPAWPTAITEDESFESCVSRNLDALRETVASGLAGAGGRVRLSFSGGYDSRLLLALLLEQGVRPELYVYGPENDRDVHIARQVAEGEGLVCRRVDKAAKGHPSLEAYPAVVDESLIHFDGWKNTGLFDNGADVEDRHSRHAGGYLPLNGGLGEIYRNFFNLFDRSYPVEAVIDAFYRPYVRSWTTRAFDPKAYKAELAASMRAQLACDPGARLTSQQAQMLYPLFRGRFWTAREAQINQRFGPMHFPYLEHRCIREAGTVPLRYKAFGRLQAAMICRVSQRLAAYPTDYGFSFDSPPGWRYRFDDLLSRLRPTFLRPHIAALKKRRAMEMPSELTGPYLSQILDTAFPYTAPLFVHARIGDPNTLNRVATMEYLAQRFGFAATETP